MYFTFVSSRIELKRYMLLQNIDFNGILTMIFRQLCSPLAHHLALEHITDAQLEECKKVVSRLHSLEVKGEALPAVAAKFKGLKR